MTTATNSPLRSSVYTPSPIPPTAASMPNYVRNELAKIQQSIAQLTGGSANDTLVTALGLLETALATEEATRASADTSLSSALSGAATSLSGALAAEATARTNADTTIQSRVANLSGSVAAIGSVATAAVPSSEMGPDFTFSGTSWGLSGDFVDAVDLTGISGGIHDGTLSLTGAAGVGVVNASGNITADLSGSMLDLYVPPLEVSGADFCGTPLDFSNVHHLDFEGNAFLSAAGLRVKQLGVLNTLSSSLTIASVPADGQWLYVEYNAPGNFPPDGSNLAAPLESIGDCLLYAAPIGTAASAPFTLTSSGESDCFAQIVTGPSTVAGHWSGPLAAGTGPSTINLTTGVGRLYVFIADRYNNVSSSVASGVTCFRHIDTTFTTPTTSDTEPNATAVTFGMDVVAAGTTVLTVTPGSPGFSSSACYIAVLLAPPAGPVDSVTVSVPPTTLISSGTVVSSDLLTLVTGHGLSCAGGGQCGTMANTGLLGLVSGGGTTSGQITLGSGLVLSGQTLSGGGGVGGINFGQLATPAASQPLLVYPVGSSGLILAAGLPGWSGYAETAPTGAVTITLYKNGTPIGTIAWAPGIKTPTLTFPSAVAFATGDVLMAVAQAIPDETFSNFGVVLVPIAGRTGPVLTGNFSGVSSTSITSLDFSTYDYRLALRITNNTSVCSIALQAGDQSVTPIWRTGGYNVQSASNGGIGNQTSASSPQFAYIGGVNYGATSILNFINQPNGFQGLCTFASVPGASSGVIQIPYANSIIGALRIAATAGTISGSWSLYETPR